ncbi:MAG: sugar phosphate isomerase/epimerase family protein [Christensenellales bacterium]
MKLAIGVTTPEAGPDAFVLLRGFENSIPLAKDMGYDGIELALKHKDDIKNIPLEKLLSKYDLEVCCITTGQVYSELHLYLTHPSIMIRQQAIDVLLGLISVAKRFGAMLNIGRARGLLSYGQTREQAEAMFVNSMSHLLDRALQDGVTLLLEPINRYEINFINSVKECSQALSWFPPHYDIGLMTDLFHMNIEDVSFYDVLAEQGDKIKYVHFADSNRLAPGWGHINFQEVFDGLNKAGFNGWGSVESLPIPDENAAALQAVQYLRPFIQKYNASFLSNE